MTYSDVDTTPFSFDQGWDWYGGWGSGGGALGDDPWITDTFTGVTQPLSHFSAPEQAQIRQEIGFGPSPSDTWPSNLGAGVAPEKGWWEGLSTGGKLALALGGIPALIGLAGVGQQLFGAPPSQTTTATTNVPPPSSAEEARQQAITQAIQQAQQFAFGGTSGVGQGTAGLLGARIPSEEAAFDRSLQELAGAANTRTSLQTALTPALQTSLPQLLGQQAGVLGGLPTAAQTATADPAIGAAQQAQALAMTQGRLPALDPVVQQAISDVFQTQRGRLVEDTIEAGRQRGFAGGMEILREPPGAMMGRALGELSGAEAQAKLGLATQLPILGAELERQRVAAAQAGLTGLINTSGAYTTPASVLLGGGINLMNLNQNIASALGSVGQAGVSNRLDFLRAISAPLSAANQAAATEAQLRLGMAPRTQTSEMAPSLLSAFAPTAQLLAGTGGLLSGLGAAKLF